MSIRANIEQKLAAAFSPQQIEVINESHLHAGHQEHFDGMGETHLRLRIVADAFSGMSRIERHRAINALLAEGKGLAQAVRHIAAALGVSHVPVPVTEAPTPTVVQTVEGALAFQDYFVRRRADVEVLGLRYGGTPATPLSERVEAAFSDPALAGIVIAPSNPFLSIAPMLSIGGLREKIARRDVPVLAVSPYVNGRAVKGPVSRLQRDLGFPAGDEGLIAYYGGLVDILFTCGSGRPAAVGMSVEDGDTLMPDGAGRGRLARRVLERLGWRP